MKALSSSHGSANQNLGSNRLPPTTFSPNKATPHRRLHFKSGWTSTIAILIIAPLIALFLTIFVFQSYEVDGASMETILSNHDRLIVLKTARTWSKITGHAYIPSRGEIVVFNQQDSTNFGSSSKKQLIKRVIGLPGERVVVRDGVLTIFNSANPDGFQPDKTLSYGKNILTTPGNVDITLGKNQLFVCGDNRPNSLDSRSFGAIEASSVVGKLALRILPLSKAKSF